MGGLKDGFLKEVQLPTLSAFGITRATGLRRRPIFAAGETAVRCIATNAWRASEATIEKEGTIEQGRKGEFLEWHLDYTGYPPKKLYESKSIKEIDKALKLQCTPKVRLRSKWNPNGRR